MSRNLIHDLDHSMPIAKYAELGTLLQALIVASNASVPITVTEALSPAQVAANTTAEQIFAVAGVKVGDIVYVNKPTSQAGLGIVGARVSSAGHVAINFSNNTGAGITPTAAETYSFGIIRAPATALVPIVDLVTLGNSQP